MRIKNMKVYDLANELAEEIKKSEEYVTYRTAKEAINLNYELKKKIDEFIGFLRIFTVSMHMLFVLL